MGNGKSKTGNHAFEGIIANMESRYHETDSQMVRDELCKIFWPSRLVAACEGARLNHSARHVFVDDQPLHNITRLPIKETLTIFSSS